MARFYTGDIDDDDGQVDGEHEVGVTAQNFVAFQPKADWLREGMPPWHLWGNSLTLSTVVQEAALGVTTAPASAQLIKVSYKRPESWQWLLSARLISGPPSSQLSDVGGVSLDLNFDLITGIGRSSIIMQQIGGAGVPAAVTAVSRSFEHYSFYWDLLGGFPTGAKIWTTQVIAPNRRFVASGGVLPVPNSSGNAVAPGESASVIDRIVAQDIQLSCRVLATAFTGDTAIGQSIVLEVSAQFAPVAHVRPDWYQLPKIPDAARFPGAETGGT